MKHGKELNVTMKRDHIAESLKWRMSIWCKWCLVFQNAMRIVWIDFLSSRGFGSCRSAAVVSRIIGYAGSKIFRMAELE
jgi:hypothetical protein